jgi:hypothetical protein
MHRARHWHLMPVILATQEEKIRRITVRSQPWVHRKRLAEWLKW